MFYCLFSSPNLPCSSAAKLSKRRRGGGAEAMERTRTGRRKIEIKRIENSAARQVTFTKRRSGLFKKVGELCIHCGAEVVAVVYSPGGKVHVYASPDEDSVLARFLQEEAPPAVDPRAQVERAARVATLQAMLAELQAVADAEKAGKRWWEDARLDGMRTEELRRLRAAVAELREAVAKSVEQKAAAAVRPGLPSTNYMGFSAGASGSSILAT